MSQLVVLVLPDPGDCDAVLHAWMEVGVAGVTLLDSSGLADHVEHRREFRDDMPLMPSLRRLVRSDEFPSRTLFSVVEEDFEIDELVRRTEEIIGSFEAEHTGFMFVMPVSRIFGRKES